MKITVMPDRSISLTLSMDPAESPEDILLDANAGDLYIYRFVDFRELIRCCRHLSGADHIKSSLYADDENRYYLILGRTEGAVDYERMVLSVNEFGELFGSTPEQEAYVREHARCLIEQDAIAELACL